MISLLNDIERRKENMDKKYKVIPKQFVDGLCIYCKTDHESIATYEMCGWYRNPYKKSALQEAKEVMTKTKKIKQVN